MKKTNKSSKEQWIKQSSWLPLGFDRPNSKTTMPKILPPPLKHLESHQALNIWRSRKNKEERIQNTLDTEFLANLHQARFQQ
ncbi:hypothetical protein G6F42_022632 [Rhizopus arrhizus]|nr:hypothetical protein G6F42_022632 [Rhizopus arrhizus]